MRKKYFYRLSSMSVWGWKQLQAWDANAAKSEEYSFPVLIPAKSKSIQVLANPSKISYGFFIVSDEPKKRLYLL